jgi:predicted permease
VADPPRLARWLLERALPPDVREDVSGDLDEMFRRRCAHDRHPRARAWYWLQTVSFSRHFISERLRERRKQADMSTGMSWIDLKLAVRMLVRYPGLTLVSVVGMAIGIAIAAGAFAIVYGLLDPVVPLADGDRIVSIGIRDVSTHNSERRAVRDFVVWRDELTSVHDLGASRTVGRNLIAAGAQPEAVPVAEITASGFRVARVSPLLGRHLLPTDEHAGAPDVVVIGHEVWHRRFAADPGILGREIQLGATKYSIVGVMPEGFGFPINHSWWIPWRLDPSAYEPRTGPNVTVFARLAPGATVESTQAELTAIGQRMAAAFPKTHEHLRPAVKPYTFEYTEMDDPLNVLALHAIQMAIVMLLVVVCVNVAILIYARTATRQGEIAVRSALGASRRRIVGQLFLEALVLAGVAAVVGLGLVSAGLRQVDAALIQLAGKLPFWMDFSLSADAVIYTVGLTVLAAAIVGVVPALKVTGRGVQARLQGLSAGSGSRMQMGRLWTLLIIGQVAIAVALLPATMFHAWNSLRFRTGNLGYATQEFLTTQLVFDSEDEINRAGISREDFLARYGSEQAELERRLEEEPGVARVTFSMANPGEERALVLEAEGLPVPIDLIDYNIVEGTKTGHLVRFNRIGVDFLNVYGVAVLTGRGFQPADLSPARESVLVNRSFAGRIFGGENPLGRRVRYVGRSREANADDVELGRWYEIVGVVEDFPPSAEDRTQPRVYHPASPGDVYPAMLAVQVRGTSPSAFADRLREIGAMVDPNLQLRDLSSADDVLKREQGIMRLIGLTLAAVMLSVVVLSGAGIYSLMSFTVARRRKEIGIRAALGADPRQILGSIFSRAFGQLAIGAALGIAGAIGIEQLLEGEMFQGHGAVILPLVALFMTVVGLLAALGPARRGLQIQPTEALREE